MMSISLFELMQETKEFPSTGTRNREDFITQNTVDRGISLQQTVGTACAIEYLLGQGVPRQIKQRVLTDPERRRSHA
ncbi:MAG: hypothetical protein WA071_19470 [Undibacterium umbellatum]|uniref:hypothetical protein n=1 Tax=Undibacterium umbellatum TaxID=2762300 RepID=UPI003BB5F9D1